MSGKVEGMPTDSEITTSVDLAGKVGALSLMSVTLMSTDTFLKNWLRVDWMATCRDRMHCLA